MSIRILAINDIFIKILSFRIFLPLFGNYFIQITTTGNLTSKLSTLSRITLRVGKIPGIYPKLTFCKFEVKLIRKEEIKIWRIDGIMSQKKGGVGVLPQENF